MTNRRRVATCARCAETKALVARGLCGACYTKCKRSGEPLPGKNRRTFEEHLRAVKPDENGCWPWPGSINEDRYGVTRNKRAHVLSYQHFVGPVPVGYDVGHVCHDRDESCQDWRKCTHRRCVNPGHLKAMTRKENLNARPWRKQRCIRGHELDAENARITRDGRRQCRVCVRLLYGERRERRQAAIAAPIV